MRRVQLVSNCDGERSDVPARTSGTGPKCVESFHGRKCDNSALVLFLFCSAVDSDLNGLCFGCLRAVLGGNVTLCRTYNLG